MSNELQWATKVAQILTAAEREFERDVARLEYKWKVERTAREWTINMPSDNELVKHDFFFRVDVHKEMQGMFDGVSMAQKSIQEERNKGWSTD